MHLALKHEVVVITHERYRAAIQAHMQEHPDAIYPRFHYHDTGLLSGVPFNGLTALPKYFVWQFTVMPLAFRLMRQFAFDLVVHVTMCTFRYPSWMGYLGAPFVIGPVGGGEAAPRALLAGLPAFERAFEALRSLLIASAKIDPLLWLAQRKAALVMTRSVQTSAALPLGMLSKSRVVLDIGSDAPAVDACRERVLGAPLRLVMVSRLLGWKGVHLAIKVLAQCRARGADAVLEVIGSGRLRDWLESLARREGVSDFVTFTGHLPQHEVMERLVAADVFLFPSLHDSGGMAVLEAMACGLPTICLDLGGPAVTVTPECGVVIDTAGLSQPAVVHRLTSAVLSLFSDEPRRIAMGNAALARAKELSWQRALLDGQAMLEALMAQQEVKEVHG